MKHSSVFIYWKTQEAFFTLELQPWINLEDVQERQSVWMKKVQLRAAFGLFTSICNLIPNITAQSHQRQLANVKDLKVLVIGCLDAGYAQSEGQPGGCVM